jgi:hypothetical protein
LLNGYATLSQCGHGHGSLRDAGHKPKNGLRTVQQWKTLAAPATPHSSAPSAPRAPVDRAIDRRGSRIESTAYFLWAE